MDTPQGTQTATWKNFTSSVAAAGSVAPGPVALPGARSARAASQFAALYSRYANRYASTAYPALKFTVRSSGGSGSVAKTEITVTDPVAIMGLTEQLKVILRIGFPGQSPSGESPDAMFFCHSSCYTAPPKSRSRR